MKLLCTCTSAFAYVSIPLCLVVLALVSEHLSLVCISLHFAVSVHGPVPVHALS